MELELENWYRKEGAKKLNAVLVEYNGQNIGPVLLTNLICIDDRFKTEECASMLRNLLVQDGLTVYKNMGAKNEVWIKL